MQASLCQSLRCSYAQNLDVHVDENSEQNLDLKPRWIRQHGCLLYTFAHMRSAYVPAIALIIAFMHTNISCTGRNMPAREMLVLIAPYP